VVSLEVLAGLKEHVLIFGLPSPARLGLVVSEEDAETERLWKLRAKLQSLSYVFVRDQRGLREVGTELAAVESPRLGARQRAGNDAQK
jgi:hypothetical protein